MATRRTIRDFAPDPVPAEAIRQAIRAAASAPSGEYSALALCAAPPPSAPSAGHPAERAHRVEVEVEVGVAHGVIGAGHAAGLGAWSRR
jgi:Nitroreductase family